MFRNRTNIPEQPKVPPMPDMAAEFDRLYLEKCKEVNELVEKVEHYREMARIAVKQKSELENRLEGQKIALEDLRAEVKEHRNTIKQLELIMRISAESETSTIRELAAEPVTTELISREAALKAVSDAQMTLFNLPLKAMKYADEILSQIEYRKKVTLELIEAIPAASTIRELAAEPLKGFTPDVEPPEKLPEALMEELPLWALQPVTTQDILCLSSALKNLYDIHKCDSWLLYKELSKVLEKKIKEYCGEG